MMYPSIYVTFAALFTSTSQAQSEVSKTLSSIRSMRRCVAELRAIVSRVRGRRLFSALTYLPPPPRARYARSRQAGVALVGLVLLIAVPALIGRLSAGRTRPLQELSLDIPNA